VFGKSYVYYYDQVYKPLIMILGKTLSNSHKCISQLLSAASKPVVLVILISTVLLISASSHYAPIAYGQNKQQQSLPSQDNRLVPSDNGIVSNSNSPLMGLDFLKSSGLFNGSSITITAGISTVNGIKVTGVNLLDNNRLAVTLAGNKEMTSNFATPTSSVSVIALRIALSHDDLASLMSVAAESSKSKGGFMNPLGAQVQGSSNASSDGYGLSTGQNNTTVFNPLSFLKNMQIGSTSLVNADWKIPHVVRMGFFGNSGPITPIVDLVLIQVIPYTGELGVLAGPKMP
jgi:hypothetical protein